MFISYTADTPKKKGLFYLFVPFIITAKKEHVFVFITVHVIIKMTSCSKCKKHFLTDKKKRRRKKFIPIRHLRVQSPCYLKDKRRNAPSDQGDFETL